MKSEKYEPLNWRIPLTGRILCIFPYETWPPIQFYDILIEGEVFPVKSKLKDKLAFRGQIK